MLWYIPWVVCTLYLIYSLVHTTILPFVPLYHYTFLSISMYSLVSCKPAPVRENWSSWANFCDFGSNFCIVLLRIFEDICLVSKSWTYRMGQLYHYTCFGNLSSQVKSNGMTTWVQRLTCNLRACVFRLSTMGNYIRFVLLKEIYQLNFEYTQWDQIHCKWHGILQG